MLQYDLIIVGGGASGLSAGIEALKQGIKKVLILERNSELGGNLNLFIHVGFGKEYLGNSVTGPEFATKLIEDYKLLGGEFKVDSEVLEITDNKVVTFVSPIDGMNDIKGESIILASGCRERFTGNINVPIHKYIGIFTMVAAHRLVNLSGYLPGKEIFIVGKNKWSLLLARRLIIEGSNVKAIIDNSKNGFIGDESLEIIEGFNINIIRDSEIVELLGNERLEMVKIHNKIDGSIENIQCDSLILTVGYYPEASYLKGTSVELDNDGIINVLDYKTSINGIYACGTILTGEHGINNSSEDGTKVGRIVSNLRKCNC